MSIDGKVATINAKRYFEESHGPFMVWEFRVEKLEYLEKDSTWVLECTFSPSMSGLTRLRYEVRISDEGSILGTKQLELK